MHNSYSTPFSKVGTALAQGERNLCHVFLCTHFHLVCPNIVDVPFVRFRSCPHLHALCQEPQRPQLDLVAVDKNLVLPHIGVECLVAWPIRPQAHESRHGNLLAKGLSRLKSFGLKNLLDTANEGECVDSKLPSSQLFEKSRSEKVRLGGALTSRQSKNK